jgi:hypothetical protein
MWKKHLNFHIFGGFFKISGVFMPGTHENSINTILQQVISSNFDRSGCFENIIFDMRRFQATKIEKAKSGLGIRKIKFFVYFPRCDRVLAAK